MDSEQPKSAQSHAAPCSNQDFDFFYAGLEQQQLLAQQCLVCKALRNPPSPACAHCGSLEWSTYAVSGPGEVYSYVVHHYPPLPGFETPHTIVLVALREGIRFVGALKASQCEVVAIGRAVAVEFVRRGGVAMFEFALVPESQ